MTETAILTDGTTVIQCSEETASRLPATWKPAKGSRGRGRSGATAARAPKRPAPKKPVAKAAVKSTEPPADPVDVAADAEPVDPPVVVATGDGPGTGWTIEQLREFAQKHEIDLGKAKKHGEILAIIDADLADDEDDDLDEGDADESDDDSDDDESDESE